MFKGVEVSGSAAYLIAEYNSRRRLAKLGYQTPFSELPAWKSEAFILIDTEIQKLQDDEMKRKSKRGKR